MPLLAATAVALVAQTVPVTLDPASAQPWEGWGTSLCWMGKVYGDREDVADLLFTTRTVTLGKERLPGLGMNVVRYNAGACSWNEVDGRKMVVSKTILPFRQMEGFWLDPNQPDPASKGWDWSLDANQRRMMLEAKRRGADRFELFSNSPMWWMCANDNPSGAKDPKRDNIRPDAVPAFAVYLAEVARRAKTKWGVAFTTIDPFNEPASAWWDENCKQEGCHFEPATQALVLARLRTELDRRGLKDLKIAASDETYVSQALSTWNAFDAGTKALVDQVNVHGYEGDKSPRPALKAALGDRPVWLSEHGENDESGRTLAASLSHDLHELRPRSWSYWQPLDGSGWGLLRADAPKATIARSNPKLFMLAQFTRHIRPGMSLLKTSDRDVVAAYDRGRRTLVVVAVGGAEGGSRSLALPPRTRARSVATWTTVPGSAALYRREADAEVAGGAFEFAAPAGGVRTFEIRGVDLPGAR